MQERNEFLYDVAKMIIRMEENNRTGKLPGSHDKHFVTRAFELAELITEKHYRD